MRIAAIYDIHGNLPALEAVLDEIHGARVDLIVVGGDVMPGPMATEVLARLLDLETSIRFIHGNGESAVLAMLAGRDPVSIPERAREAVGWVAAQLNEDYKRAIADWPATFSVQIDGMGEVLFCHATPRNDTEIFTRLTPEELLVPIFGGIRQRLVVCGHTHMQFDRVVGSCRVVNAGSVGMPFGEAGADWLLLGPDVQLRHTDYDLASAAERIRNTAYPQAEEFAARYITDPPSQLAMLELYSKVSIGQEPGA